ncbi:glycosyltransferase family 2 protein [Acidobacteria bacterium AH-259-A15]|nr:glycosyltransferase family 2 protein [Acidobacteria bacterium AH-259-A15]
MSVVLPHGGHERLAQLRSTLANLAQHQQAIEVVVVDMGPLPVAEKAAREADAKHFFVRASDAFERGRAMNVGSSIACHDLVLWHDNDLLFGREFLTKAVHELDKRGLDYLIPYTQICYLSEVDSRHVMDGNLASDRCRPVKTLLGGDVNGGMGLVRKAFLDRFGEFVEEFRGWGGEDNAWLRKVKLLGKTGVTERTDQDLYHLFHENSGAFKGAPLTENPHYARNVALLAECDRLTSPEGFLKRFPTPAFASCPWDRSRPILFLTELGSPTAALAAEVKTCLEKLYGAAVSLREIGGLADAGERSGTAVFEVYVRFIASGLSRADRLAQGESDSKPVILVQPFDDQPAESVRPMPPGTRAVVTNDPTWAAVARDDGCFFR